MAQVQASSALNDGQKNSLTKKLEAAQAAIAEKKPNATNELEAFINEVEALKRSGRLAPAVADTWIAAARAIIGHP
jgi:hypothetical protein